MSVKYLDFEIPTEGVPGLLITAVLSERIQTRRHAISRPLLHILRKRLCKRQVSPRAESGAVRLCLKFFFPPLKSWTKAQRLRLAQCIELPKTTKPDVDNLGKAVCDGLNGIAYRDDAMVASLEIEKVFADRTPGISVHLALDTDE